MSVVQASTLENAYEAARNKIRGLVVAADVTGVSGDNFVNGVGTLFTKTWEGPSGIVTYEFISGENRSQWAYVTGLLKSANKVKTAPPDPETEMGLLTQVQYQDVWGVSKNFSLQATASYRIYLQADVIVPANPAWSADARFTAYDSGYASDVTVEVDGVLVDSTTTWAWEEVFNNSLGAGEPDPDITTTANEPPTRWLRRSVTTFVGGVASAGDHTVRLMINPRAERAYVARRLIVVEAVYV